jgi:succinate dehydrogenase / fumarate reductase, cytochrome b subunit
MTARPRPTSPHLFIYRFTLTMAMSIIHRITGGANYVGTMLLVAWLGAAALGPDAYALAQAVFGFWLIQLILFGYTWSLIHHMLGGIRHFIWDNLKGLDDPGREWLVAANITGSIILTLFVWSVFVWFR